MSEVGPSLSEVAKVVPKPPAPKPTTARVVNGTADAVEAIGKGELAAIQTVDEVARGEMSMPQIAPDNPEPRPVVVPVPTSEGVDSAGAPAEASPPATSSNNGEVSSGSAEPHPPEIVGKENSPEEQFGRNVLDAEVEIGKSLREGKYTDPKQIESAQRIVDKNYDVKELLTLLNDTKESEIALKTYEQMSQNVFVSIGGKTYLLSALEAERAGANEARQKQIDEIISGGTYELSFDEGKFQEASVSKQKEILNSTTDKNIADLRNTIVDREAKGQRADAYKAVLKALELAQKLKGDTQAFYQIWALRRLRASGLSVDPSGLNQAIDGSGEVYSRAQEALFSNALDRGYTEDQAKFIVTSLAQGDFEALKRIGFFQKPGVDKLLVGRELSEKEWDEIFDLISGDEKRKFGKDEALMILLMALVGVTQATRQAVMGELKR